MDSMKTTSAAQTLEPPHADNSVLNPTPKRRRGREAEELAKIAATSVHKARMALEVKTCAPELFDAVAPSEMRLSQALRLVREFRPIKPRKEEITFTEQVTRSFARWSHRWPADVMPQVHEIIHRLTSPDERTAKSPC
jgi:hypothetical protein